MKTRNVFVKLVLALATVGLLAPLAGCGDDHEHEHENNEHTEQEAPPDHACEHAQNGPFVPENGSHTAAEDAEGDLPVIHAAEWATIELTDADEDGAFEGFVNFEAAADGGYRFFTSVAWPGEDEKTTDSPYVVVTNADGDDPSFEAKHPVGDDPGCAEVNFNHFYEGFEADTTYTVQITGHPEQTLSIVPVPEGEGGHEAH